MIIALLYLQEYLFLLNAQISALSSLLLIMASYQGYKKMIQKKAALFEGATFEDEDEKIEDPHGLWEEDTDTELDSATLYQEERTRQKKTPVIKNTLKSVGALFAPLRLVGYLFFLIGLFTLINYEVFEPLSYLLGLAVMPIAVTIFAFKMRKS